MNNTTNINPDKHIASSVVSAMVGKPAISATRMTTGDQYFVFAVKTADAEYVIRMTDIRQKAKFLSAIYWQEQLLPLGIPLAKFIDSDLEGKHSPFPALLMMRLPGDDLCNVYLSLTDIDKKNLATHMAKIQATASTLPLGIGYGITDSYEHVPEEKSWYDFLLNRLHLFKNIIAKTGCFDPEQITKVITIANHMKDELSAVTAIPFLWDASERNVIVFNGKITGIVDVDDICFGDPLFVLALTHAALALEGLDTLYTDYWEQALHLDKKAQRRLKFYRLFYAVVFMRKHAMQTTNSKKVMFDTKRLCGIFQHALKEIENNLR